jgi:tetratricopeptide (TPR) repeat protein
MRAAWFSWIACFLALATQAGAAEPVGDMVKRLGARSFREREAATADLVGLGKAALPALEQAAESDDPEVAWRASEAARMIRYGVTPALRREIGDAFHRYEAKAWTDRERLTMDIAAVGDRLAMPALVVLLTDDPSVAVKRAATMGLLRMGPEGLSAIERSGAKFLGLPAESADLRVQIGNGFLEEGKYERAVAEYKRALDAAPKHMIAWYNLACAYSRLKQGDEAVAALAKSIEFGYEELDWMLKDPDLDNIREHPGYQALIRALEKKRRGRPPDGVPPLPPPPNRSP